uniref:Uncharacterized protein n=1 Tax=Klebsiella pneumoniae TaxID=573 RepID=A0A2P1BNZ9_KLEPN|nr:hypothetical protein [Klebsiella pneumoniae]
MMLKLKLRVLTRSRSRVISFSSNSLMNSRSKLHEESLWIYGGSRMTKAVCAIRPSGIAGRPLLEGQQSNNITLIDVLEGVHVYRKGILMTLKYRKPLSPKKYR